MDYNFIRKLFQAVSCREGSHDPQRTSGLTIFDIVTQFSFRARYMPLDTNAFLQNLKINWSSSYLFVAVDNKERVAHCGTKEYRDMARFVQNMKKIKR
ncbi:13724_t:CDS:2 [Entrophospora sp. SA101]|nr:13724_t:CDS:2 [Entrophospora sp. SA101]